MSRALAKALGVAAAVALLAVGTAYGLHLRAGNLIVDGDGSFSPTVLPKDRNAPIEVSLHGKIRTADGSRPSPLQKLVLEVDKHSAVETRGLPQCPIGKLVATTTEQARRNCPGAIIGSGFGTVVVELPEQRPIETSSPITIFNGQPKHGNPTAIGHAHIDYPGPTTIVVPAEIQKVHHGRYGYKIVIEIPKLINGYGSPTYGRITIDRKWRFGGKTLSIANARCADGRLQGRAQATFADGTILEGGAFKRCTVRKE